MPEDEPNVYAYPKTREFLIAAANAGATYALLEEAKRNSLNSSRRGPKIPFERPLGITLSYFASPESLENVGRAYSPRGRNPLSRETVRMNIKRTIEGLWRHSPPEVQAQFPLKEIPVDKPSSLTMRRRRSEAKGGLANRTEALVRKGADEGEINDFLRNEGFSPSEARKRLAGRGVDLPVRDISEIRQRTIQTLTDPDVSVEQFEKTLHGLTQGQCRYLATLGVLYSLSDTCGLSRLFVRSSDLEPVRVTLQERGIHIKTNSETVKSKGRDIVQRYHYIAKRELKSAREILVSEESLSRFRENPVKKVAGPEVPNTPTTTEMIYSSDYVSAAAILRSVGIKVDKRNGASSASVLDNSECPVPVYTYKGRTMVHRNDSYKLREYAKRLKN